jgi:hypothetical protein
MKPAPKPRPKSKSERCQLCRGWVDQNAPSTIRESEGARHHRQAAIAGARRQIRQRGSEVSPHRACNTGNSGQDRAPSLMQPVTANGL